jgi:hypothetical protein
VRPRGLHGKSGGRRSGRRTNGEKKSVGNDERKRGNKRESARKSVNVSAKRGTGTGVATETETVIENETAFGSVAMTATEALPGIGQPGETGPGIRILEIETGVIAGTADRNLQPTGVQQRPRKSSPRRIMSVSSKKHWQTFLERASVSLRSSLSWRLMQLWYHLQRGLNPHPLSTRSTDRLRRPPKPRNLLKPRSPKTQRNPSLPTFPRLPKSSLRRSKSLRGGRAGVLHVPLELNVAEIGAGPKTTIADAKMPAHAPHDLGILNGADHAKGAGRGCGIGETTGEIEAVLDRERTGEMTAGTAVAIILVTTEKMNARTNGKTNSKTPVVLMPRRAVENEAVPVPRPPNRTTERTAAAPGVVIPATVVAHHVPEQNDVIVPVPGCGSAAETGLGLALEIVTSVINGNVAAPVRA